MREVFITKDLTTFETPNIETTLLNGESIIITAADAKYFSRINIYAQGHGQIDNSVLMRLTSTSLNHQVQHTNAPISASFKVRMVGRITQDYGKPFHGIALDTISLERHTQQSQFFKPESLTVHRLRVVEYYFTSGGAVNTNINIENDPLLQAIRQNSEA